MMSAHDDVLTLHKLWSQEHLVWFNELVEELLAKKVGVYGVCAQPPSEVDQMVAENNLKFKVKLRCLCN